MSEYISREDAIRIASGYCHPANIADELAKIPAADVRPVVRGRWEYDPGDNIPYCSECMMPQDSECNYCPNCGAVMEES